ncbi:MAG: UDP-N-acetylglucosamine 2-epimerase [Anaerolineales bacterium]
MGPKGVHQIGDVMYDALLRNLELSRGKSHILKRLDLKKGEYALATVHRAGNTDNPKNMRSVLDALGSLPIQADLPAHPRTRSRITSGDLPSIQMCR